MKTKIFCSILILSLTFGCNLFDSEEVHEFIPTEKTAELIKAENVFGFELFQKIYSTETEYENIMVSPLSVSLALAMTYNGANGETKTAMEETLKVYGLTPDEINLSYFELVNALKSLDEKVLLEIANAIFYRNNFNVEDEFITTNQNFYNAEIDALNFNSPEALNTINSWVAEKTHNKIKSILKEIKPSHVMFLLNAIYFKGIWKNEFDKENTHDLPFYTNDVNSVNVPTMIKTDAVSYTSNNLFSAVQLPYGKGNYNMYVFLPHQEFGVQDIVDELDEENWSAWIDAFGEEQDVNIQIPRLKYKYEIKLNEVLSEMGMGIAFGGGADFTGINNEGGLYIDYVKHKTFVEVNEEGTEAAAVTVVAVNKLSAGPQNILFIVNRPFLYAITEKSTGAVLFLGTVKNPKSE